MGTEKLTSAEQAAEKTRKAELAAEIERMDDTELALLAKRAGVDPAAFPKRPDLVAAIELKAEQDAALGRQALRDMDEGENRKVLAEDDRRAPTARILRALNAEFCRDIPQEGRAGSFAPDDGDVRFGGEYDVPDGKYRVGGSDWVFEITKKKLAGAVLASEANRYGGKGVIAVE